MRIRTGRNGLLGLLASLVLWAVLTQGPARAATDIVWWHAMQGELGRQIDKLADDFNRTQSDYRIVPVFKGSYTETVTAAIFAFRSRTQPAIVQVNEIATATMMAAKGATDPDPAFRRWTATLGAIAPEEAVLRPLHLQVVQANSTSPEELARRMAVPDRALDRFLVLNGLERGAALAPGRSYKIVTE